MGAEHEGPDSNSAWRKNSVAGQDLHTLDAKVDKTRKELSEQIVGLRRAVVEYHSSAVGHGVLFSELEERVRRLEQHLNLPAGEAH